MSEKANPIQPQDRVLITGDHPMSGYTGVYAGEVDTPLGKQHKVILDAMSQGKETYCLVPALEQLQKVKAND